MGCLTMSLNLIVQISPEDLGPAVRMKGLFLASLLCELFLIGIPCRFEALNNVLFCEMPRSSVMIGRIMDGVAFVGRTLFGGNK